MQENKVISSSITRDHKSLQNNLYDLLAVKPATPAPVGDVKEHTCDFQPVTGKIYTPKKKHKFSKVKTVRYIRNLFETDISIDLSKDLEKQQKLLLKKITCGSSREENTKEIARNMLKCDKPVSRSAWQMLMNVNTEGHPHAFQYVLWNGKRIRVNGSKGGKNRFICNYDLAKPKVAVKKEKNNKSFSLKKGLLQNSLQVKFKPGPLSKKRFLDDSFQKFNVGKTELLNLPKPGLDIQPVYGVSLEPMIANFVQNLRDSNGTITKKWAEFAVSVVGSVKNKEAVQDCNEGGVIFELNYKRDQRRMLLRKDVNKSFVTTSTKTPKDCSQVNDDSDITSEVENILEKMLDSVEISLQQEIFYTGEDEPRDQSCEETVKVHNSTKDKTKKWFCELDRLDVTVIRLPDIVEDNISYKCRNAHCSLGCICSSLHRSYHLSQHCGRIECMFECKCDYSKYKIADTLNSDCSELIPGLINFDNKLNSKLAKEEQKFHQTVVLTGEKSILLKSEKRNWKATKKYGDFYDSMCLKNDVKCQRILSVVDVKLNCEHIEPWCMVHNLYKCFCKGKFTQKSSIIAIEENNVNETTSPEVTPVTKHEVDVKDNKRHRSGRNSAERIPNKHSVLQLNETIDLEPALSYENSTCARTRPYAGRKFYDAYYVDTNKKILEMEKNDIHLRKRMFTILNRSDHSDASNQSINTTLQSVNEIQQTQVNVESNEENSSFGNITENFVRIGSASPDDSLDSDSTVFKCISKDNMNPGRSILNTTSNKAKLIAWLESSYKQYKQRIERGIVKKSLDPPKHGKVALYPWDFILTRYRERKNLFLINLDKPFRIFMAVDGNNSFFKNCINIDDIRFADLHKYPATVKNLLTNATELKDNFCILCGLSHCWELIGSVTKLDDQTDDTDQLQSVADDKKIAFIAQDKEEGENSLQQPGSSVENKLCAQTNKKSKKRRLKFRRSKKTSAKKIKTATNKEDVSEQDNPRDNESGDIIDDSEDGNSNSAVTSTSYGQDQDSPTMQPEHTGEESIKSVNELNPEATRRNDLLVCELPETQNEAEIDLQLSKWFVMTVENDFTEIQFYNRGFFVKYESIIKAINVARMSGKTVRLSSQKSGDQNSGPQFGIYAIPNSNEYYVFIGPYDKDEPLGIETVKSFSNIRTMKTTRGVWITTKKFDNVKVIDNPLSFMPNNLQSSKIVSLDNEVMQNQSNENDKETIHNKFVTNSEITVSKNPIRENFKIVKPIKIRKTNGFYQLAPQGYFTQVLTKPLEGTSQVRDNISKSVLQPILLKNLHSEKQQMKMPLVQLPLPSLYYPNSKQAVVTKSSSDDCLPQNSKPVAEIAPQIKIIDVYSESTSQGNRQTSGKKAEGGSMFILKPEEINKRLLENTLAPDPEQTSNTCNMPEASDVDQDIENFLKTSSVYIPPNADIFEISDEDDDDQLNNWRTVWIECESAHVGFIKGRKRDSDNMLSFEFPGFKFTDFYPEEEALCKINQVLSRKIYVPKSIKLKWRVVDTFPALKKKYELKAALLGPDFVLTKRGVRHKQSLMFNNKSLLKTEVDSAIDTISEMEEQSKILEEESDKLMSEMAQMDRTTVLETLLAKNTEEAQYPVKRTEIARTYEKLKVLRET